jgi:hypothetical protein
MRKNLNADVRFAAIRKDFAKIADHRANNKKIPLVDAMMNGFAMFSLQYQSLLAFDERRCEESQSLHGVSEFWLSPETATCVPPWIASTPDTLAVLPFARK